MLDRWTPRAVAAALSALVLLVGCSDGGDGDAEADSANASADPKTTLRDAVEAFGDWDGVSLELRVEADEAARASLADDELGEEEVDLLLSSALFVSVSGGDRPAAEFRVNTGGADIAELRLLDERQLYLRLDLAALGEVLDEPELTDELDEMVAAAREFGLEDLAEAVTSGGWIHLTGLEQLQELADELEEDLADEEPELDEQDAARLMRDAVDRALRFLDEDVDVESLGSDDVGERLRVTTDGASLRQLLVDLGELGATIEGADVYDELELEEELADLEADVEVSVDVWVDGGQLRQVAVDAADLDEGELDGELLVLIGLQEFDGSVQAPADAATVDLFGIIGQFMGGLGGDMLGDMGDMGGEGLDDLDGLEDELGDLEDSMGDDAASGGGADDLGFEEFDEEMLGELLGGSGDLECVEEEDILLLEEMLGPDFGEMMEEQVVAGVIELC